MAITTLASCARCGQLHRRHGARHVRACASRHSARAADGLLVLARRIRCTDDALHVSRTGAAGSSVGVTVKEGGRDHVTSVGLLAERCGSPSYGYAAGAVASSVRLPRFPQSSRLVHCRRIRLGSLVRRGFTPNSKAQRPLWWGGAMRPASRHGAHRAASAGLTSAGPRASRPSRAAGMSSLRAADVFVPLHLDVSVPTEASRAAARPAGSRPPSRPDRVVDRRSRTHRLSRMNVGGAAGDRLFDAQRC